MNAFASSSSAPLYVTPSRKQNVPEFLVPALAQSPWAAQPTVQYDHRGRLQPYVETSEQRRARSEFLRKREFSRRINAWIEGSHSENSVSGTQSSSDTDSLHTIDEDDEAEPEIIYATAPLGSRWAPPSATLSKTPARHLRASSRTSSMSSLSSISEESTASA